MLAKGRLLGVQFDAMFDNDLYFEMGRHAVGLALKIRDAFAAAGYPFLIESPTNQQFVILPDADLATLERDFAIEYMERVDADHSGVRFCTSWATKAEDVDTLIEAIEKL